MALGLVVVFLSQTAIADRIYFPFGFINKLLNFQNENQLTIGPYKDGTIILVKPVATGVGSSRAEAGDVVEVRDGQELFQRFGNDKPFLGKRERTKLLVFYYDGKLTQEQKQQLISPVYETKEGEYITNLELYQTQIEESQTGSTEKTDNNEETNLEQEPQIIKNRAYGIDYTKILSDKDILIARDPNKAFDKLPELDLTYLIKKQPDQFSVVEMTDKLVRAESITQKIEDTLHKIVPLANAQTACVSIVDPDNGDGTDYLSLNTWESTEERDLVTANETETATCRSTGGTADTTAVAIDGWTTDSTHYIKAWTDPDEGYRHEGVWDDTKYRVKSSDWSIIVISESYTRIDGLQVSIDDANTRVFINIYTGGIGSKISNNIIQRTVSGDRSSWGINCGNVEGVAIWNNVIYNMNSSGSADYGIRLEFNVAIAVYNNTIYNCESGGITISGGNNILKNNLAVNNGEDYYVYSSWGDTSSNISSDNTSPDGADFRNKTVSFLDSANNDFHLAGSDTAARDAGTDLSNDANLAFSDDIDGERRGAGGAWDIGADERTSTVIETDPTVYRSISDPTGTNPTPFIATIMESGGDYSSLSDWEDAVECDLTATTTRVYSGSLAGSLAENASVTLADSSGTPYTPAITGTVVAHTANGQILIDNIDGSDTLQASNNDRWEADDSNYWTVSGSNYDLGDYAYAVAKIDGTWDEADSDTTGIQIDGWTTDADHYIKIYTTDTARHNGRWDETAYRIYTPHTHSDNTPLRILEEYTVVDGLQVEVSNSSELTCYASGIVIMERECQVSNNITKKTGTSLNSNTGIYFGGIPDNPGDNASVYIWNNIIYGFQYGIGVIQNRWNDDIFDLGIVYNNTIYNTERGMSISFNTGGQGDNFHIINNIVNNSSVEDFGIQNVGSFDFNISSDDTASECGGTGNIINTSVIFEDEDNGDFHLAGSDTAARDAGTDLSNDANLAFSDDIDGESRGAGGAWDIGADEIARITQIITDPTAGRSISDPTGTNPTPFIATIMESGGDYSSLFDWEAAIDCDLTAATTKVFAHNGITGTISDGATVTGANSSATGTCLHATDNQILIIGISGTFQSGEQVYETQDTNYVTISDAGDSAYAVAKIDGAWSSADDTAVTIDGWTTDADHYVHIYTTAAARHNGKWDESAYRIDDAGGYDILTVNEDYAKLDGLQIKVIRNDTAGRNAITYAGSGEIEITNNLLERNSSDAHGYGRGISCGPGTNKIYNNIIYNWKHIGGGYGICASSNGIHYIYNNTIYNCGCGIRGIDWAKPGSAIAKNNITQNCNNDYHSSFNDASTNNIGKMEAGPGGSQATVNFADATNDDFHLALSDTSARDAGADLSADANLAFSDDIDGERRGAGGAWDIGADEIARTTRIK